MIELEGLRTHLLKKTGAHEDMPFGPDVLVYKVSGKMFALLAWQETPLRISLKCDPDHALALRDIYEAVQPGYHLNKRHWNTVTLNGSLPEHELLRMVDDSYRLIVKKLKKVEREALGLS